MLISYEKKFIFIHVKKVAGLSIEEPLTAYSHDPDRIAPLRLLRLLGAHHVIRHHKLQVPDGHATIRDIRDLLPREMFDSFFKFAFVRNPWDWQVSWYHFVLGKPILPHHKLFKSFGSFEKYLEWCARGGRELQKDYLVDEKGRMIMDFVGRFESLAEDFASACQKIGVEARLPHLNRSSHEEYKKYYTPETRDLVAEVFREDIEAFGYSFEAGPAAGAAAGRGAAAEG